MRHLKAGRKLSRNASHRRALFRNLALAVFRHERILTTVAKAKEARRFIEKLITLAKKGLANGGEKKLHYYRLVLARLGTAAKAEINPEGEADKQNCADAERKSTDVDLADQITDADCQKRGENWLSADDLAG